MEESKKGEYIQAIVRGKTGDPRAGADRCRAEARAIGRNSLCPCGSGRKVKKCCGVQAARARAARDAATPKVSEAVFLTRTAAEPYMELLPSMVVAGGKRMRWVYNRVHWRRDTETFHEFLIYIVKLTLGKDWADKQLTLPLDRLPAVFQWLREWADLTVREMATAKRDAAGAYTSDMTVGTKAALQFGYDLFCLQAKDRLPGFLVEKLRRRDTFQSARYEVAVAALMMRSGFKIEFLDDQGVAEKHCEFIATHIDTGEGVGVEAKSRRRAGVLHEKGERESFENDADGLRNLIRKAKKQKPEGLPLIIFVDLNLSDEDTHFTQGSPLVESIFEMVRQEHCSEDRPAAYAAVILTNFVDHHAPLDAVATKGVVHMGLPLFTEQVVSRGLLNRVVEVATRYDRIPDNI